MLVLILAIEGEVMFARFVCGSLVSLFAATLVPQVQAQGAPDLIPDRRVVLFQDTDLPGGDLRNVFDVSYDQCQAVCLADTACTAFTYNSKASACFPKADPGSATAFEGAWSGYVVSSSDTAEARAQAAWSAQDFLRPGQVQDAIARATEIGGRFPVNGWSAADLRALARDRASDGNLFRAAELEIAALNRDDAATGWITVARLLNEAEPGSQAQRRFKRRFAVASAINGYLRAGDDTLQAAALAELARGLEAGNNGRQSIKALRLAAGLSPSETVTTALDRAVGLYGFRVAGHRVEQNAASPRVCVEFSQDLVAGGVDYGDYVRASVDGLSFEPSFRELCMTGADHGAQLALTLRRGLPAKDGEVTHRSVDLEIYVPDRDPQVRFAGRAYVLPKRADATVPVISTNTDALDLTLYQVTDRNLLRVFQDGLFAKPLQSWETRRLDDTLGQQVWQGSATVQRDLNKDVTTALPVGDAIADAKPGVYALTAKAAGESADSGLATQWFVISDIGLSSIQGLDGLHVFARALGSAEPLAGVEVALVARNNQVLGTATTDAGGQASFAPGLARGTDGAAPALITAHLAGDFTFLDQGAAEFDLSDRGVAGRAAPGPIDVFATTERGAYRPGATIHATVLARDPQAKSISGLPLTAELLRPDGVRYAAQPVLDEGAGGAALAFDLPANAARGGWQLRVLAEEGAAPLAVSRLLVEDFIPERIDFDLAVPQAPVSLTDAPVIGVETRYLYGAPAADLVAEGEIKLSRASSLPGYPGYVFGRADEGFSPRYASVEDILQTDATGRLNLPMPLPQIEEVFGPLTAEAFVRLRDGSARPVERRETMSVAPDRPLIGIKPLFEDQVPEGGTAEFELIAVGPGGERLDLPQVDWEINRIHTSYQWYESYGDWSYEPITRRERVGSGTVPLVQSGRIQVAAPVTWGDYEIRVQSASGVYTISSMRFGAGWYVTGSGVDTPDVLAVALDQPGYAPGDTAKLRITSRFEGVAQVSVLSDRLIETREIAVNRGDTSVDLRVSPNWGSGAYVAVTAYRPMDVPAGQAPARALGLVHASVAPGTAKIAAEFTSAPEADPRSTMEVALKVEAAQGEPVYATIAAVDLGVLNLTGFEPPAPDEHYLGQRRLGVELRDLYGRLIDGMAGDPTRLRSGGDSLAQQRLNSPPPTEAVLAQFSGVLVADATGQISTSFDLPDFNGTVRLMAVVWSDTGTGHAVQDVLVRDPIVLSAHLPRQLAPGDRAEMLVELAHAFGPTGDVKLSILSGGEVGLDQTLATVSLSEGERHSLHLPIRAERVGTADLRLRVEGPTGTTFDKDLTLAVRHTDPPIARQTQVAIAPGASWQLDGAVLEGLHPGTARATLALGPLARFNAPGLLAALDRYPYGCTEQVTSRAMPLLQFDQVSRALGLGQGRPVAERIDQAITAVLANQSGAGSFGLWRPANGDLWLDAYVTDFLSQARAQGHVVPDRAFDQALRNLRNQVNYSGEFEFGGQALAYALHVLAREGKAAIGDLRYYADTHATKFATPLARAQMGAALASYGDQPRADRMFGLAQHQLTQAEPDRGWRDDYGTSLRDAAAVLSLAVLSGSEVVDRDALVNRLVSAPVARRSTQENAWSLMAAAALADRRSGGRFALSGRPMEGQLVAGLSEEGLREGRVLENLSDADGIATLTVFGVPSEPEPAAGDGYRIERAYYTLDGEAVELASVLQNTRLVTVLTVTPLADTSARLMVDDPLPAGLEIDNPNLLASVDLKALDWLNLETQPRMTEFRGDRFLAAVDWGGTKPFSLAYMVRAVTPGSFHHPAAVVEDMYRPANRARTAAGRLTVTRP